MGQLGHSGWPLILAAMSNLRYGVYSQTEEVLHITWFLKSFPLRHLNVKIAQKPHSALRSNLVHVNDPVPTLQRHKVIYQIPCSGCDRAYTG